jgi:hypothetical protein
MRTVEKEVGGIKVIEVIIEESDMSSPELKQQRLATCYSCEFVVKNETCSKCSCLLANRIAYIESFCPVGKW